MCVKVCVNLLLTGDAVFSKDNDDIECTSAVSNKIFFSPYGASVSNAMIRLSRGSWISERGSESDVCKIL